MQKFIRIRGIVESKPDMQEQKLEFRLRSGGSHYFVIRLDPAWQKRDILFLDTGQVVEVLGTPFPTDPATILATAIHIRTPSIHRLLRSQSGDKERENYGSESQR